MNHNVDLISTKKMIVTRMVHNKNWNKSHTAVQTVLKHFKDQRTADKAIKELIKEGLVVPKPTSYGKEISLNIKKIAEIRNLLDE